MSPMRWHSFDRTAKMLASRLETKALRYSSQALGGDTGFRRDEVKNALRAVIDTASGKNLVSTGSIQNIKVDQNRGVKVNLDLLVPGHPYADKIKEECVRTLELIPWVTKVEVDIFLKKPLGSTAAMGSSLRNVEHVIAVSSCKGGVGKSTVAVNLATELVKRGLRVGLLDADIFGPSLPLMVEVRDPSVQRSDENPKWIKPLRAVSGLDVLSFGHVNPRSGAPGAGGKGPAVMRGPIATRVITQLVTATEWGALDYLIVDMPPGTGDVQITLAQCITFTGAVIVTTPHELSLADATKGVAMFQDLRIPTLAVVENMSYFECDLGTKYYPFGIGGRNNLLRALRYAAGVEVDPEAKNSSEGTGCGSKNRNSSNNVSGNNSGGSSGQDGSASSSAVSSSLTDKVIAQKTPPSSTQTGHGVGCSDHIHDHTHSHVHSHVHGEECSDNSKDSQSNLTTHSYVTKTSSDNSGRIEINCTRVTESSSAVPTGQGTLYERLLVCPLHCLPLSREVNQYWNSTDNTTNDSNSNDDTRNSNSEEILHSSDDRFRPPTPVVLGSPHSKIARIYSSLADDVIVEILKLQIEAQGVPSLSISSGKGIVLRYYTQTSAIEYVIPGLELRVREPSTGLLLADHESLRIKLAGVVPVFLDLKGNYGVAINWSDGHYADIFPFDILREIGENFQSK